MSNSSNIRTGRHCDFSMHVHLVFVTKYRKNIFTKAVLDTTKQLFEKICNEFESELIEIDGERDHVHLLIYYPPKVAVAKLVNSLKGVSSRRLKQLHPEIKKHYWKNALWSPSYFSGSCGGASIDIIREYIEQQEKPL